MMRASPRQAQRGLLASHPGWAIPASLLLCCCTLTSSSSPEPPLSQAPSSLTLRPASTPAGDGGQTLESDSPNGTDSPPSPPPAACKKDTLPMEVTAALTAMYNSTGGALWKRKKGWTVGDPCKDSWEGIECVCPGGEQVSIIILNLASNNMGSAIPKETFATGFKELQKIDLSLNHLRGPLPRLDSDELFNLEYVYLQQEDSPFKADTLTGDVSDLWGLYNLKELNIRNNHGLNGTLPQDIGRKVNLLSLVDMAGTGISGDLPESFWSIPSLSNVDISGLGLKGSIGEGVVEMQDFHVFLASENQLTGTIPAFHPFAFQKSHSTIILNNNKLENIPAAFFNAGVQDLAMSNNSLRGLLPPEVVMAKGLQHFFIDHNQLSGPIPTSLCSLVGLVEFKASFNYFSSIPDCFGEQLSNLQYLDLFNNVFTGTLPMNAFCGMGSLKQLQLQNNVNLGGALSPCITAWGDLEVIIIDRTQISGTIPVELFSLKKLDTIILSQSKFNGSIPDMFDKTPNVRAVVFQSSHVGEIVLTPHFVGTIPKTLFGLTALESLTLQFNRLSGTIPDLFGKAQYLSQIALNNNLLEGTVPQSIVDALKQPKPALMNSTRMLFLNSNLLTGTLPDFSKSQNTEAIVINSNQFVGYIPLVYNKSYTWLNSTGTFYDKNRFMTFFSGMRLFPPVPLFAKYMSAGNGVGFYPTGHLSVDGNPLNTVNRDAQQTIQVEAQFLCDSPDFWGKGDPGIFMKVEGDADALDSISPSTGEGDSGAIQVGAASWLVPVVSKIPQNASYAAAKGNVTFQIPSDVLQALPLGSLEFSIWFWGNTRANESDVSNHISRGEQLSVGSLPNAVLYDPNPPIQEIFPKEGRKWGCAYINVTGSSFSDTGSSNIKCRFTPLPAVGEGRKVSQVAVAAFDTPGSCINDTAVGCFVGVDNSTGYSLADYLVSVSLDRGEHWSQQVGEDANLTYTFTDDCSVSAEIPSLRTDCLCDMCECTSAGSCSMNTTQPPTCACLEGFTGENCDQCLPLFWGIDCKPCPTCNSPHGTCQDTKLGSGDCSCEMWYAGSNCGWYYKYWLIAALPSCLFVTVVFLAWKCCLKKRFAASRKAERIPLRGVQDR